MLLYLFFLIESIFSFRLYLFFFLFNLSFKKQFSYLFLLFY